MKIAVLSGKGGTGKTTVSASLVSALGRCQYIDCDVEEPNGAVFLQPELTERFPVDVPVPVVDESLCNACGDCAVACQFNALAVVKARALVFPEICHHCGACVISCPQMAIQETARTIGVIEANEEDTFMQGKLNIGEPVGIPIIRELKKRVRTDIPVILDCPPGASCAVVQCVEGCDYCLLVAEPTPFGVHDLNIAVRLIRKMGIPFGVVINKAFPGRSIKEFCQEKCYEVLMEIPFSKDLAEGYSKGLLPQEIDPLWRERFLRLYGKIERCVLK